MSEELYRAPLTADYLFALGDSVVFAALRESRSLESRDILLALLSDRRLLSVEFLRERGLIPKTETDIIDLQKTRNNLGDMVKLVKVFHPSSERVLLDSVKTYNLFSDVGTSLSLLAALVEDMNDRMMVEEKTGLFDIRKDNYRRFLSNRSPQIALFSLPLVMESPVDDPELKPTHSAIENGESSTPYPPLTPYSLYETAQEVAAFLRDYPNLNL